jgi:hypothetical protein
MCKSARPLPTQTQKKIENIYHNNGIDVHRGGLAIIFGPGNMKQTGP